MEIIEIFKIGFFGYLTYICKYDRYGESQLGYLHKDNTLGRYCGSENFFNDKEQAEIFLRKYLKKENFKIINIEKKGTSELFKVGKINEFITKDEMEI